MNTIRDSSDVNRWATLIVTCRTLKLYLFLTIMEFLSDVILVVKPIDTFLVTIGCHWSYNISNSVYFREVCIQNCYRIFIDTFMVNEDVWEILNFWIPYGILLISFVILTPYLFVPMVRVRSCSYLFYIVTGHWYLMSLSLSISVNENFPI